MPEVQPRIHRESQKITRKVRKKLKKKIIIGLAVLAAVAVCLIIYPTVEFQHNGKLVRLSYSDDLSEYEENASYDETFFYYKKRDISIKTFDIKKFLCFYVITMEYEKGNLADTQFLLEEDYIENFLKNAEITENPENIDLAKLIEGKTAIVKSKRYLGNDYETAIYYKLDGRHEVMYIFYTDDLLVLQIGHSDEGPKFIAYK